MKTIDACGISCPEPLMMLCKALKTEKEFILLLDNKIALENCEYYAKSRRISFSTTHEGNVYKLSILN
jgi:TusA-related sulfurtransferase